MSQIELGVSMLVAGLLLGMVFYHHFGVKRAKIARLVALIAECTDMRFKEIEQYRTLLSTTQERLIVTNNALISSNKLIREQQDAINCDTERFEKQVRVIDELRGVINDQSKELRECWAFASDQVSQLKSAREIFIYYPDGLAMVDRVIGQLTFLSSKVTSGS